MGCLHIKERAYQGRTPQAERVDLVQRVGLHRQRALRVDLGVIGNKGAGAVVADAERQGTRTTPLGLRFGCITGFAVILYR